MKHHLTSFLKKAALGTGILTMITLLLLLNYDRLKIVEHHSTQGETSKVIHANITQLSTLIAGEKFKQGNSRYKTTEVSKRAPHTLFELTQNGEPENNNDLLQYLSLSETDRVNDLYINFAENGGDIPMYSQEGFWDSEYFYQDIPAPFITNFFLHLEPQGDQSTKVTVIEVHPGIVVGSRFVLLGHEFYGPHFEKDIRTVAPTTKDRVELLSYIENLAMQDVVR